MRVDSILLVGYLGLAAAGTIGRRTQANTEHANDPRQLSGSPLGALTTATGLLGTLTKTLGQQQHARQLSGGALGPLNSLLGGLTKTPPPKENRPQEAPAPEPKKQEASAQTPQPTGQPEPQPSGQPSQGPTSSDAGKPEPAQRNRESGGQAARPAPEANTGPITDDDIPLAAKQALNEFLRTDPSKSGMVKHVNGKPLRPSKPTATQPAGAAQTGTQAAADPASKGTAVPQGKSAEPQGKSAGREGSRPEAQSAGKDASNKEKA
ncbi:hypothetical protein FQN57_002985 [Myotisia sp. PD_48]|nr:hypothetical protein FQN57_002985 [Myotisia sp. PD_48]